MDTIAFHIVGSNGQPVMLLSLDHIGREEEFIDAINALAKKVIVERHLEGLYGHITIVDMKAWSEVCGTEPSIWKTIPDNPNNEFEMHLDRILELVASRTLKT